MPFFTKEDMDQGNWCHRTEELMAMVNIYHSKNEELKEENEELKRVADHAEKVLEDSPVEEDDEGFAISDWFHEKMAKHIKFHMTDPGGEYNYIDPETKKHIFCLGSKGTLDDCRDFVENLEKEIEELKIKLDEGTEQRLADTKKLNEYYTKVKEENEELKEDKEELFDAWLHYWSAAQLGCEHSIPMSEQEGGKYQILLDELDF